MATIDVGIGFATGRRNFKELLQTYINNWTERGHTDRINIHLLIAYDLKYFGIQRESFVNIDPELLELVHSVTYIGDDEMSILADRLASVHRMSKERVREFFFQGYAGKRNQILYHALLKDLDYLLFLDDDEYPIVPVKDDKGMLSWIGQDILGTHLRHLPYADVTVGYHSGYISPIPYFDGFGETFSEEELRAFIEAISNDIIDWNSIREKFAANQGVTYGHMAVVREKPVYEIRAQRGGKWVAGSNLGLNLHRIERIPAFYNPPNGRGEDTFFSTELTGAIVRRVPCYTFHDGFLRYLPILHGVLPERLAPVLPDDPAVIQRFLRATKGWVAYKPLLLYVTQRAAYAGEIAAVRRKLRETAPRLAAHLNQPAFLEALDILDQQDRDAPAHHEQLRRVQAFWGEVRSRKTPMAI